MFNPVVALCQLQKLTQRLPILALLGFAPLVLQAADQPAALIPQKTTPRHKLLVVSVDGLDWRYLRDRDRLGLRIPNIRRLMDRGWYAEGVVGVWPTITWPSHTTLITGARPDQHGILGNRRPKSEGGDYYWTAGLLKTTTLWKVAHDHGLSTAAITWPVTVTASIDFNLPEYFQRRNGGFMDLASVESKATPGFVEEISKRFPSFPQQWIDDAARTQAVLYLLQTKRPDLILVHLVDLDAEEHEAGPFGRNANAMLEKTDELLGEMLGSLPKPYELALVSDHGFERVEKIADVAVLLKKNGITGDVNSLGGIAVTSNPAVAEFLRKKQAQADSGIGREIPHEELVRLAPSLHDAAAAFEPAEGVMFGSSKTDTYFSAPAEIGNHGFWPARHDYRSIFLLYGHDVKSGHGSEIDMLSIAGRLAHELQLELPSPNAAPSASK